MKFHFKSYNLHYILYKFIFFQKLEMNSYKDMIVLIFNAEF